METYQFKLYTERVTYTAHVLNDPKGVNYKIMHPVQGVIEYAEVDSLRAGCDAVDEFAKKEGARITMKIEGEAC